MTEGQYSVRGSKQHVGELATLSDAIDPVESLLIAIQVIQVVGVVATLCQLVRSSEAVHGGELQ